MSKGFIRFASTLCDHDRSLGDLNSLSGAADALERLVRYHAKGQMPSLKALSLVSRMSRDPQSQELHDLVEWVGPRLGVRDTKEMLAVAGSLHASSGFIGRTSRVMYVTPEVVAKLLFEQVCAELKDEFDDLLDRIPSSLIPLFRERVLMSGDREVRARVVQRFQRSARELTIEDFATLEGAKQAEALVESNPTTYVPWFADLIDTAPDEAVREILGGSRGRQWGPRRKLVWLTQRFVAFSEHFYDGERVLLKFALNETEPDIGNNATAEWIALFRIVLGGTEVPYSDRLALLKTRLESNDQRVLDLASRALSVAFDNKEMRMSGDPSFAGRLKPREWSPKTQSEWRTWENAAADVAMEFLSKPIVGSVVAKYLSEEAGALLYRRRFDVLEAILSNSDDFSIKNRLNDAVSWVLSYGGDNPAYGSEVVENVRTWSDKVLRGTLADRLLAVVGHNAWYFRRQDQAAYERELASCAQSLKDDPDDLSFYKDLLTNAEAVGVGGLGGALARSDPGLSLLSHVVNLVKGTENPSLLIGYFSGASSDESNISALESVIERLEANEPTLAFRLSLISPKQFDAVKRALALVDSGQLPVEQLESFAGNGARFELSGYEVYEIISRFVKASSPQSAASEIVHFLWLESDKYDYLADERLRELVKPFLSPELMDGTKVYEWAEVVKSLSTHDLGYAVKLAIEAGLSSSTRFEHGAEGLLTELINRDPSLAMEAIGFALLSEKDKLRLHFADFEETLASMPADTFNSWLDTHGKEGAMAVAGYLPRPNISEKVGSINPNTETLLRRFGDDPDIYEQFESGVSRIESWWGSGYEKYTRDAEGAESLMRHPISAVRKWARRHRDDALKSAEHMRRQEEEENVPRF